MQKTIHVPILIQTYECGPPALEQCPECRFGEKVERAVGAFGEDGIRKFLCTFGQDAMRRGVCVFFQPRRVPKEISLRELFHP